MLIISLRSLSVIESVFVVLGLSAVQKMVASANIKCA